LISLLAKDGCSIAYTGIRVSKTFRRLIVSDKADIKLRYTMLKHLNTHKENLRKQTMAYIQKQPNWVSATNCVFRLRQI